MSRNNKSLWQDFLPEKARSRRMIQHRWIGHALVWMQKRGIHVGIYFGEDRQWYIYDGWKLMGCNKSLARAMKSAMQKIPSAKR